MARKPKPKSPGESISYDMARKDILNDDYELVPVSTLKEHPDNPNDGDVGAIYTSIGANGFFGALVVSRRTHHILAGNHRFKAAKSLDMERVPVLWVDVDAEEEKRILVADNRTTRLGHDDDTRLASILSELALTDSGLLGTGYDGDDLDDLIARIAGETDPPRTTGAKEQFQILIICETETQQAELLTRFAEEHLECRALIS